MKKAIVLCVLVASISFPQTKPSISPIRDFQGKSSEFGRRLHPIFAVERDHNGVDLLVPIGTPVLATANGKVMQAKQFEGYGLVVRLRHGNSFTTVYSHLSKISVKRGQTVKKGEIIAYSGNSGLSSQPHLHYEVLQNGKNVNPRDFIAQR